MSRLMLILLKAALLCVAVLAPIGLLGCSDDEGGTTYPPKDGGAEVVLQSILVHPSAVTIEIGEQIKFQATGVNNDGTTTDLTDVAEWVSTNPSVAEAKADGVVEGKQSGMAVIAAKVGELTGAAQITVGKKTVVMVQVAPAAATIAVGTTQSFTASAVFGDGTSEDVTDVAEWTSSAAAVASVDSAGLATALAGGTSTISAAYSGKAGSAQLTVSIATVESIVVTPTDVSIAKGTTQQFQATATLSDQSTQDVTNDVAWSSSHEATATISAAGLATGVAPGTTTIGANLGKVSGGTSLTVLGAVLQSIQVTLANPPDLPVGATFAFKATGTFSDQGTQDITELVTWASSATNVATISNAVGNKGVATGVAGGTTNITASASGVTSAPVALKVLTAATLSYITIEPPNSKLNVGQTLELAAIGHYSDSSTFDLTHNVQWAAVRPDSDTAISNFSIAEGKVTALSSTAALPGGFGRVKASQGSVSTYATVAVKDTTITAVNVDCEPSPSLSCIPAAFNFPIRCVATATFSDGTTGEITGSATWSSSNSAIAAFQSVAGGKAVFSVIGEGSAAILAAQGGKTSPSTGDANAIVRGVAATPLQLDVSPPDNSIPKGAQIAFHASAKFKSAATGCTIIDLDVTDLSIWSTSNANVVSVSNASGTRGLAEGLSVGVVQVQVAFDGIIGFGHLTVQQACLQSVNIEQIDPTYPDDVMVPLTVKGTYSDQTTALLAPGAGLSFSVQQGAVDKYWNLDTSLLPASSAVTFTASSLAGTCAGAIKTSTTTVKVDSAATLTGLSMQPPSAVIPTGGMARYQVLATFLGYSSAFNVSKFASWTAAQPVSGLGHAPSADRMGEIFAAGTASGNTTVTAVYESLTAQGQLGISGSTVKKLSIVDIAVGADSGLLGQAFPVGLVLEPKARVELSDGTVAINPTGIVFSSDDTTRLVIDAGRALTMKSSNGIDPMLKASYGGVTSEATAIHIEAQPLDQLSFSPDPLTMPVNSSRSIQVRGTWGGEVTYHFDLSNRVTCTSGNSAIVSVTNGPLGTLIATHATATGTTPVPVTCLLGNVTAALSVRVNDACITTVAISPPAPTLPKGTTGDFVATATYSDGSTVNITELGTWTFSGTGVLTDLGPTPAHARRFKAASGGSASISFAWTSSAACAGGVIGQQTVSSAATVVVSAAEIASVVIQPSPVTPALERRIPLGETIALHAYATLTDGSVVDVTDDAGTVWSSQMPGRASVSSTGVLSGIGTGKTIIEVLTSNGKLGSLMVDVQDCGLPTVTVTGVGGGNLPIGTLRSFRATALYLKDSACTADSSERTFAVTEKAQWSSSNANVAAVSTGGTNAGKATGLTAGSAKISATYRGVTSGSVDLTVVAVTLSALQLQPASPIQTFVGPGSAVPLHVVATYSDGSNQYVLDPPPITWLVVDPSIVSVGANNQLVGLKVGSTTVRAQYGAIVSDAHVVTVSSACITGVTIVNPPVDVTLPAGVPIELGVQCATSDGSVLPCNPSFSVSIGGSLLDFDAASFPSSGKLRVSPGAATGSAALKATVAGCTGPVSDDVTVMVGSAKLASLRVAPGYSIAARGTKKRFQAFGWFTGGSGEGTYDVTRYATFVSSNPNVATVDGDGTGNVTAKMLDGNSIITVSYLGSYSNAANLVVSGKTLSSISVSPSANCTGTLGSGLGAAYPIGQFLLPLQAIGHFSDNTSEPLGDVTWSLGAPIVAGTSIDPTTGVLTTGTTGGTQVVRASRGGLTGSLSIGIVQSPIASVAVTGPVKVPKGIRTRYTGTVTLVGTSSMCSDNTYAATANLKWASSDPTKGSIVASGLDAGLFSGIALGQTNVTAVRGTATGGPVVVDVTNAVKQSVRCIPSSVTLTLGGLAHMRAVVTYSDLSELDEAMSQAEWNSSIVVGADKIAFPGAHRGGTVMGLASGSARVEPFVNGGELTVTQGCQVTVN